MTLRLLTTSERRLSATLIGTSPDGVLEPIDVETTKQVLRFTSTSEDNLIAGWITAARQYFEDQTSRQVMAALWEVSFDAFPVGGVIELPHPPLLELVSVVADGTAADASLYTVLSPAVGSPNATVTDPFAPRAQIALNTGSSWPSVTDSAGVLTVTFWAGYGSTQAEIPEIVKACLYDLVRHFHNRPDGDLPMTTQVMLRMFRQSAITQVAMEREWV